MFIYNSTNKVIKSHPSQASQVDRCFKCFGSSNWTERKQTHGPHGILSLWPIQWLVKLQHGGCRMWFSPQKIMYPCVSHSDPWFKTSSDEDLPKIELNPVETNSDVFDPSVFVTISTEPDLSQVMCRRSHATISNTPGNHGGFGTIQWSPTKAERVEGNRPGG